MKIFGIPVVIVREERKMQIKRVLTTVRSYSNWNKTYDIYEGMDGILHCSCPSSIYQSRECKHISDFILSPQYTAWIDSTWEKDEDKTLEFVFNSNGYLRVQLREVFTEATLTPEEVTIMIEKIEDVLPFMRFFVGMDK